MAEVHANGLRFHVQRLAPPEDAATAEPTFGATTTPAERPTVVFIHGLVMDNLSSWFYTLANPVAQTGAQVIMYDLRGHGRSERPATGYALEDAVDDLIAVLDELGIQHPVYLVGNSYGGVVATRMALDRPERVAGLVLIEGHCAGSVAASWIEDIANTLSGISLGLEWDRVYEQYGIVGWRKFARQATIAHGLLNETTLIDDLAMTRPLASTRLSDISCPVLALYGEHSELVGAAYDLARYVPDCTVEIVPDVGHTVLREATDAVRELMLPWLAEQCRPVLAGSVGT